MERAVIARRGLLLGATGVVLAGCSGGSDPSGSKKPSPSGSATASGPIIHGQDAGTVILDADVDALIDHLNDALAAGDVDTMAAMFPGGLDKAAWRQRLETLSRFPMEDLRFGVDRTFVGRQVNSSGGTVKTDLSLFLIHQVEGADGVPVVQQYSTEVTKADPKAPLVLGELDGPEWANYPAPWDLRGDWEVLTAEHAVLAFRKPDRAVARRWLQPLSEGVGRALQMVPPPAGVTRMFLTMDSPESQLFLEDQKKAVVRDRAGFASRAEYLDPTKLTVELETDDKDLPFATSRIVIHPSFVHSDAFAIELAAHETAHGLAAQWGLDNPPWITEGFATWVESGGGAGVMRRFGGEIRGNFAAYRARMKGPEGLDYDHFQHANVNPNYDCSAAVLAYVEATHGRAAVLELTRRLYQNVSVAERSAFRKVGARDLQDLLAQTEAWL